MGKIKVLDEHLANQIAAGEVVERPASVVKELVENAVDAGATSIDITIEEGGLSLIRVQDNGSGIEAEDMETAFQRHATSKLLTDRDLFRIASLGFRGEALPSIAAVAKVDCVSANSDSGLGRRIAMEGGQITADEHAGAGQGTDMTVRELFFNTPARLKYMKSIQTELGHISDYIYRIALAHPGIAFSLTHNGGNLLRTTGSGDRLQVIAAVYGTGTAKAMVPIRGEHPDYELNGYISKPELTRSSRTSITTVVNGRYIRSFAVQQALLAAYHTLLPINRFPVAVLEIGMHPSLVDVNVHPSKMEVRFSKEAELKAFVEETARGVLGGRRHIPGPDSGRSSRSGPVYRQEQLRFHQPEPGLGQSGSGAPGAAEHPPGAAAPAAPAGGAAQPPGAAAAAAEAAAASAAAGFAPPLQSEGGPRGVAGSGRKGPPPGSVAAGPWRPAAQAAPPVPPDAAQRLYAPAAGAFGAGGLRERQAAPYAPAPSDSGAEAPASQENGSFPPFPGAHDLPHGYARDSAAEPGSSSSPPGFAHGAARDAAAEPGESAAPPGPAPGSFAQPEPSGSSVYPPGEATLYPAPDSLSAVPDDDGDDAEDVSPSGFPELSWVGQLHGTYLIAQNEEGMYLIDQHAAHERINYEYYYRKFGDIGSESQPLLVPFTLEYTSADALLLADRLPLLAEAGVELEPFGSQAFLVRSHPHWFPKGEEQGLVEEMAEWVLREKRAIDIAKLREEAAIMCSCKASIKANDRLSREEGEALLARLAACVQPYTCPHGRPILVHISVYQLEKMFKRVMS
ncbi:DNA mismatch repair endonuclease MutL [Paenibacillus pasadenensis]|uniref:DNA mismatch repair endonuclease MutL n=1 Tax=Paenibacillus pasadenensis TaxID=217090 RepID=UPI00203F6F83|nr:DNA mismatch repair endonuclease MutL [Paenibacillus pasadenensis]MCM3748979.1 DNA mismatch repair endonuclease MutL [Paenibacillus pasadenensis]